MTTQGRVWVLLVLAVGTLGSQKQMFQPRYVEDGELVRPEGYREWVFVGASLGMGYEQSRSSPAEVPHSARFHNIYIQPEAYRRFAATGEFPDKTVLVMEVLTAGSNASINRQGRFEDRAVGIEAAVKDTVRFPEKWSYYSFIGPGDRPLAKAKPFDKDRCWSCHRQHGAVDNVFVQFYPVLREARARTSPSQAGVAAR